MSSSDTKDPTKLLESLLSGGEKLPTMEEIQAKIDEQEKEISSNFRKLETKDIVKLLVSAENYVNMVIRSNPSLTQRNHSHLHNARILIGCVLDGKLPDNYEELKKMQIG